MSGRETKHLFLSHWQLLYISWSYQHGLTLIVLTSPTSPLPENNTLAKEPPHTLTGLQVKCEHARLRNLLSLNYSPRLRQVDRCGPHSRECHCAASAPRSFPHRRVKNKNKVLSHHTTARNSHDTENEDKKPLIHQPLVASTSRLAVESPTRRGGRRRHLRPRVRRWQRRKQHYFIESTTASGTRGVLPPCSLPTPSLGTRSRPYACPGAQLSCQEGVPAHTAHTSWLVELYGATDLADDWITRDSSFVRQQHRHAARGHGRPST